MENQSLVFNENAIITTHNNEVIITLDERMVRIKIKERSFSIIKHIVENGLKIESLSNKNNVELIKFIKKLNFNDILINEKEREILKYGVITKPLRINKDINPIPDKKVDEWCMFGAPIDFANDPPRSPSNGPYVFRKIGNINNKIIDIGDIYYSTIDNIYRFGDKIMHIVNRITTNDNRFVMIGGDHSLTYFTLKELSKKHSDIILIQFDAHSDIDKKNNKNFLYHANFLSKSIDDKLISGVIQIGIRERFINYEKSYLTDNRIKQIQVNESEKYDFDLSRTIKGKNIYITFDADSLDPKVFPHVTTPLDGGMSREQVLDFIKKIKNIDCKIIGADIMEFTCGFDEYGNPFNKELNVLEDIINEIID